MGNIKGLVSVRAKDFNSAETYLRRVVEVKIKEEEQTSFGAEIFNHIQAIYDYRLRGQLQKHISVGNMDNLLPRDGHSQNMKNLNKKILIQEKKRDLEKQIFDLRMRGNALMKNEYEDKMTKLQLKWAEIEQQADTGEIPSRNEIEKMVGLVKDSRKKMSLVEIMRDRSSQDAENKKAKQFVKRMRKGAEEREALKEALRQK